MKRLSSGKEDPDAIKFLMEAEAKFDEQNAREIELLTAGLPRTNFDDDEAPESSAAPLPPIRIASSFDSSFGPSFGSSSFPFLLFLMSVDDDEIDDDVPPEPGPDHPDFFEAVRKSFEDPPPLKPREFVYRGYEKMRLYRQETNDSAYASTDRIFAHLKGLPRAIYPNYYPLHVHPFVRHADHF